MKIAIGNDHRGVGHKLRIVEMLQEAGIEVLDLGCQSTAAWSDYPDYAIAVGEAVVSEKVDRGILICATGHGMCIAANKVSGVRAVNCRDAVDAEMSRLHNNSNVICLAADLLGEDMMERMIKKWTETQFEAGRHQRRLDKVTKYESDHMS